MNIDWTHKAVKITDIRKVRKFYVLSIDDRKINSPLFVDHKIIDGRLNSYYLIDVNSIGGFTRESVLQIKWNMVINKGYFIKYDQDNNIEEFHKDPEKFYISFLEIDGPLGMHISS